MPGLRLRRGLPYLELRELALETSVHQEIQDLLTMERWYISRITLPFTSHTSSRRRHEQSIVCFFGIREKMSEGDP